MPKGGNFGVDSEYECIADESECGAQLIPYLLPGKKLMSEG